METRLSRRSDWAVRDPGDLASRLMEHLAVPMYAVDRRSTVVVWNKACERLTGVAAADVLGTGDHRRAFSSPPRPCLADLVVDGLYHDLARLYPDCESFTLADDGVSMEGAFELPRRQGMLHLSCHASPIFGKTGELIAAVETIRDITAQKASQNALESLVALDGLTNLTNRRGFDVALTAAVQRAARESRPLSLLMVDVDHFKTYNDSYGHQQGDTCLRTVADRCRSVLRGTNDVAARYGGEEFAVIMPDVGRADAEVIAERIRAAIYDLGLAHAASTIANRVTLSIGGVSAAGGDLDANLLVMSADEALYASKRSGRNRCSFADYRPSYLF